MNLRKDHYQTTKNKGSKYKCQPARASWKYMVQPRRRAGEKHGATLSTTLTFRAEHAVGGLQTKVQVRDVLLTLKTPPVLGWWRLARASRFVKKLVTSGAAPSQPWLLVGRRVPRWRSRVRSSPAGARRVRFHLRYVTVSVAGMFFFLFFF